MTELPQAYSSYAEVCVRLWVSQWLEQWTYISIVDDQSTLASRIELDYQRILNG